jgi:hypothetical protein
MANQPLTCGRRPTRFNAGSVSAPSRRPQNPARQGGRPVAQGESRRQPAEALGQRHSVPSIRPAKGASHGMAVAPTLSRGRRSWHPRFRAGDRLTAHLWRRRLISTDTAHIWGRGLVSAADGPYPGIRAISADTAHICGGWRIYRDDGPYPQIRLIFGDDAPYPGRMVHIYRYAPYPWMTAHIWAMMGAKRSSQPAGGDGRRLLSHLPASPCTLPSPARPPADPRGRPGSRARRRACRPPSSTP